MVAEKIREASGGVSIRGNNYPVSKSINKNRIDEGYTRGSLETLEDADKTREVKQEKDQEAA